MTEQIARHMTNLVVYYVIMIIILTVITFQQPLAEPSAKEHKDNQIAKFPTVTAVNDNTTNHHSEIAPGLEEPPKDDVVNCAALGCPNNPPNLHGPPTEEPEGMDKDMDCNDWLARDD
jgi:hypothetical protein